MEKAGSHYNKIVQENKLNPFCIFQKCFFSKHSLCIYKGEKLNKNENNLASDNYIESS